MMLVCWLMAAEAGSEIFVFLAAFSRQSQMRLHGIQKGKNPEP